ncbi:MAG: sigma-70 family RNA polymerase sigma factor [Phycisphaerae bacterium]|nr:sigma-70 family RNA polymerase sigma factor [Phycisphaerae bacterium]
MRLIAAWKAGDGEALGRLLKGFENRVYATCWRITRKHDDALDMAQQTFINAIKHLEDYDGRAQFGTWIYRICTNACISHLRREKVRRHEGPDSMAFSAGSEPLPDSSVETAEVNAALHQALDSIDPDLRALLVLRDGQGLDYSDIAHVLGVPVGTVKSRLFRARAALRDAVGNMEGGAP